MGKADVSQLQSLTTGVQSLRLSPKLKKRKGPKRPRPDLHHAVTCFYCKSRLEWSHILKRHQRSWKCTQIRLRLASEKSKIVSHGNVKRTAKHAIRMGPARTGRLQEGP